MKKLLRIVAHLIFACGLFVFYILPSNKYGWMQELDPSISADSLEDVSGNRAVFTSLLLILIISAQFVLVAKVSNKKEKAGSIVLILVAIFVWLSKFGP